MLQIVNPATEEVIDRIEEDTVESVAQKFNLAQRAQKSWSKVDLAKKIAMIDRFKKLLDDNKESLAALLTSEVGKPLAQSRNEINGVQGRIDFFTRNVEKALKLESAFRDSTVEENISHEALGVVANISAWNYPYFVGSNVFIPALLTGNTVLYKPSEFSTLTGLAIAKYLYEAGIPKDVFIPIIGGASIGASLLELPLNGVFFTGSYATGKKIASVVAPRMIKFQLELGGKDPVYLCEDINLKFAVESSSDGAFYNAGQSCCSVERIYVHEKIYEPFVENFVKAVKDFVVGDPQDAKTYIGPLTRAAQREVLERQVADAVAKGAKLLCGGKRIAGRGNFFEPTVLVNVSHDMEVMREESFGPIIGIQKVKSDEDAISKMNESPYGLTAGVYCASPERAKNILAQLNAGSVYWNCCDRVSPNLPWSGRGHSGIGSTLSLYGIYTFLQPKGWHLKAMP